MFYYCGNRGYGYCSKRYMLYIQLAMGGMCCVIFHNTWPYYTTILPTTQHNEKHRGANPQCVYICTSLIGPCLCEKAWPPTRLTEHAYQHMCVLPHSEKWRTKGSRKIREVLDHCNRGVSENIPWIFTFVARWVPDSVFRMNRLFRG